MKSLEPSRLRNPQRLPSTYPTTTSIANSSPLGGEAGTSTDTSWMVLTSYPLRQVTY